MTTTCPVCEHDSLHTGTVPESDVTVFWCDDCEFEDAA